VTEYLRFVQESPAKSTIGFAAETLLFGTDAFPVDVAADSMP
jgi:hypothetical protein